MILRFRVLGFEVWRLELITDDEAEEEEAAAIGGSSTHDFERDPYPPTVETPWEDKRFGFTSRS